MSAFGQIGAFRTLRRLPYDAEVEYLESTGTQWIDTGLKVGSRNDLTLESAMAVSNVRSAWAFLFGASKGGGHSDTKVLLSNSLTATDRVYAGYRRDSSAFTLCANNGLDTTLRNMYRLSYGRLKIATEGGAFLSFTLPDPSGMAWDGDVHVCSDDNRKDVKIYSFRFFEGDALICDLIPVRFTNENGQSEGAMYDRANPTVGMDPDGSARTDGLYRNQGTGSFIIGNDL